VISDLWSSLYLQGSEGIKDGRAEVGFQHAEISVLQPKQQMQIQGVSLIQHLETKTVSFRFCVLVIETMVKQISF